MKAKMIKKNVVKSLLLISTLSILIIMSCQKTYSPATDIELLPLFTDNMVLQQKQDIPIWGTAKPGGEVVVTLNEQKKSAIVNDNGNWEVNLSPVPAGGPYELEISGKQAHKIKNVMVGEVWICSGQSNMEMAVNTEWGKINNAEEEVANANYPNIRLMIVQSLRILCGRAGGGSCSQFRCPPAASWGDSETAGRCGRCLTSGW